MFKKFFAFLIVSAMVLTQMQPIFANTSEPNLNQSLDYAYAELGQQKVEHNMRVWQGDVNEPTVVYEQGRYGWSLDPANATKGRYIYCSLDEKFLKNLTDGSNIEIEIDYFDSDRGTLTFEYGKYVEPINTQKKTPQWNLKVGDIPVVELPYLDMANSKTWRTHKVVLPRAALMNTLSSADFRIGIYSSTLGYSKTKVTVGAVRVRDMGTDDIYDIKVSSKNTGNIFFTGQDMEFDVSFDGSVFPYYQKKYGDVKLDVTYKLIDSYGKLTREKSEQVSAKAFSKAYGKVKFEDIERYDTYTLRVEAKNDEHNIFSAVEVPCSYSFTTYGEVINPHHGVSVSFGGNYEEAEQLAELVRNAGYDLIRINVSALAIDLGSYEDTYATNQRVDNVYDGYIKAFVDKGIKISMYTAQKGDVPVASDGVRIPETEEEIERWLTRQMRLIDKYADVLTYYDIDNEPDLQQPLSEDRHAARYAKAQNRLYEMAKKKYPHITFGGGTVAGTEMEWMEDYMNADGLEGCDVYAIHPYVSTMDPISGDITKVVKRNVPTVTDIRKVMDDRGYEDKGLYITEYGSSAYFLICDSLYLHAAYNLMHYMLLRQDNTCDYLVKFMFTDSGSRSEERIEKETMFGTVRSTVSNLLPYSAKPDYLTQSVLNYKMADAEYVERVDVEWAAAIGYRYKKTKSGKDMLALIGNKEAKKVSFDLGTKSVTLTDMFGNETTLNSPDGTYTFSIKNEAIYIEGNFSKFEMIDEAKIGPEDCRIVAAYDRVAEIPIVNKAGIPLDIEVETMDGSKVEVLEKTNKGIRIKLDKQKAAYEYLRLKVKNGKNVYFDDKIAVVSEEPVSMDSRLELKDGVWELGIMVTNNSQISDYKGTLNPVSPTAMKDIMPPTKLDIKPGETQTVVVKMPEDISPFRYKLMTVEAATDEGGIYTSYSTKLDFAYAVKAKNGITVDGNLDDWDNVCWINCDDPSMYEGVYATYNTAFNGVDDLHGKMAVMWDEENFYYAAEVYDDIHHTSEVGRENMWQLDDIQLGLIYDPTNVVTDIASFEELSMAKLPESGEQLMRHRTAVGDRWKDSSVVDNYQLKIVRDESTKLTRYELAIPWESIAPVTGTKASAGTELRLGALINENDDWGREGYYEIGGGIANAKSSKEFLRVPLVEE